MTVIAAVVLSPLSSTQLKAKVNFDLSGRELLASTSEVLKYGEEDKICKVTGVSATD